MVYNYIFYI